MNDVLSATDPDQPSRSEVRVDEARTESLRDGTEVRIRPIQRGDMERERRFIEGMSARSRRFRFLDSMTSPSSALLRQLVEPDVATDAAYVAVIEVNGESREIGVARFSAAAGAVDCEFAVAVDDAWQRQGLGTLLMQRVIEAARARGLETLHSNDARDNEPMRRFAEHLHYRREPDPDDAMQMRYSVDLAG